MRPKMRIWRMARLSFFLACVAWVTMAPTQEEVPAQDEAPLQARLTQLVAHFLGVPQELLKVKSVQESTFADLPVYSFSADVVTPDGRTVTNVGAHVDLDVRYVASAWRSGYDTEEVVRAAEEFARANFPGWSDRMVLQYAQRSRERVLCRWVEKDGDIWTGSFVGMTCTVYRPGAPTGYTAYVATPRTPDDTWLTEEQAKDVARAFLADHDIQGELQFTELHLDNLNRRFPCWWVVFQAKHPGARADGKPTTMNVLVHAISGGVVWPKVGEQE